MPILQTPQEFLQDFNHECQQATSSIYAKSMNTEAGEMMSILTETFSSAVKRGVQVHLIVDWITRRYSSGELQILPILNAEKKRIHTETQKKNTALFNRLKNNGIDLMITNKPTILSQIFPAFKRNHVKIYAVGDRVAWMGGINLFDKALETIDFMVKFTEPEIVQVLIQHVDKVNEKSPKQNIKIQCNPAYTFLMDAGKIAESIIYNEALDCLRSAKKKITYMSQLLPEGKLLNLLIQKAKAGLDINVITSPARNKNFTKWPYRVTYLTFLAKTRNVSGIKLIHLEKIVHAKLIIVDQQEAMFGSHNFVATGVLLGTQEVAMRTKDETLLKQLEAFIQRRT